jgi:7-cyano-7-deazaguanine synthase
MTKAVVLLSGGMDSATCLALATRSGAECFGLSFDYGQRHRAELDAAAALGATFGLRDHRMVTWEPSGLTGSALTDADMAVPEHPSDGIPVTYVPARNTIFLSFALGWAEELNADEIYVGVNAIDYSGYPDCRPDYIQAFQTLANLATRRSVEGDPITIVAPLIDMTKQDIVKCGVNLGVDFARTVSCYQADENGRACGRCDACTLRRKGFVDAGIADPTRYRAEIEN